MVVEIALNLPLRQTFDYEWPNELPTSPQLGIRVLVPFGPHKKSGVVVRVKSQSDFAKLKKVEAIIDEFPVFSEHLLNLTRWVSEYYYCSWGEVLNAGIPGGLGIRLHTQFIRILNFDELTGNKQLSEPIVQLISTQDSWTLPEWKQCHPTPTDQKQLQTWIKKKEVERHQTLAGTKTKPKMERWIRILDNPPPEKKRTPRKQTKREKILNLLKETPEVSMAVIKDHIHTPATVIKQLKEEGIVEVFEKRIYRRFLSDRIPKLEPFQTLTPPQQTAYQTILQSISDESYRTFLLHGVTGSGKTEVYLHAVNVTFKQGKSSLVLVPEISLTPQLIDRFRARFGDQIAVLHSGMDDGERFDEWSKILEGRIPIVIGVRSAVFAPLLNIGLIVVDEEHDSSYKQSETPRYNGRDIAILRGYRSQATVILGSATPSLEACFNVNQSKFDYLNLPSRIHQMAMPHIELLDLKYCQRQKGSYFFSVQLVEAMRQRLLKQEQILLFLNRRGYSTLVRCEACGWVITCRDCSLSMVLHQSVGMLKCHQCDYSIARPQHCPHCNSKDLRSLGVGTEQVESELKVMFPEARILRMDRDTLHGKHALGQMLDQIRNHSVDIVIGTQLVTKGHDFPNITLVGVMLADISLNFPDFRSAERTFQILTQVAGRAGRGEKQGDVLIQTYNPQHHSLQCTQLHDFDQFRDQELRFREQLKVSPFTNMVLVLFSSPKEKQAESLARQFDRNLSALHGVEFFRLGPIEAPIQKIQNRYRWMIILKASHVKILHQLLDHAIHEPHPLAPRSEDRIVIDVDPYDLL